MTLKKILIITLPSIAILTILFFIPINEFFDFDSQNKDSPSPIMILENSEVVLLGLKIIPVGCNETSSGLTESLFQIRNSNEDDYEVEVKVSFTDNEVVLYEKQVVMEILAGQTVNQNHFSDQVYDNPVCVVQIVNWTKI